MIKKKDTPDSWDWREQGAVGPIVNLGLDCHAFWANQPIEQIQTTYAIKTGNLYILSVQNLLDCVSLNYGCGGGYFQYVWPFVINNQHGKINLESDYPYIGKTGTCQFDESTAVRVISNFYSIKASSEIEIADTIFNYGSVSINIDDWDMSFLNYKSGIYKPAGCSFPYLSPYLFIGFGNADSKDYWIVKNTLGTDWGENGYMRYIRNINCSISTGNFDFPGYIDVPIAPDKN